MTTIDQTTTPRKKKRGKARGGAQRAGWLSYTILGIVMAVAIYPLYWTFMIASGDATTITRRPFLTLPGPNFVENLDRVINSPTLPVSFWNATLNSIIVSTVVALSVVFFSTLAGYSFAKLRFRGRQGLFFFVIATLAVPTQLAVVPLYIVMINLHLTGNLLAVILPAVVSAFGVFWMAQYLEQALPYELIEAARVDGASMFRTFWSIALPSARPAAAMLGLFIFIQQWTNYFWPFIVLDNKSATLPVALATLSNNYFDDYSLIFAGVIISIVPLFILFLATGRQLVAGIMEGAVKG
jgi:cellobiose transport system permease protein